MIDPFMSWNQMVDHVFPTIMIIAISLMVGWIVLTAMTKEK
jgi:hypothetical protein